MTIPEHFEPRSLLVLVAGAKGAIGSTLAAAAAALAGGDARAAAALTTRDLLPSVLPPSALAVAGWDIDPTPLPDCIGRQGIVPEAAWRPFASGLASVEVRPAPEPGTDLAGQVEAIAADIRELRSRHPERLAVLVDLLPAAAAPDLEGCEDSDALFDLPGSGRFPDLAYALAAVRSGVPVVNFTPNALEAPALVREAEARGVPLCGRDGKTGQTYFKLVLATALKARRLRVDGWYSLNILGNADGRTLMDPECARGKLDNKTRLLDEVLGYRVGERYGEATHKVHIDYYRPRGDAKEAWDVVDIAGLFDLPMSLRIDFQGRDSILAAPMAIDLARWMALLKLAGRSGPVPELAFYFKRPLGTAPPLAFDRQLRALEELEADCLERLGG